MAKPLRAFRKYQKQMLVFFGVLLMIAFILGGVLTSMPNYSPGREPQDTISVRWDGASYGEEELALFLNHHILAQQFLFQLSSTAQQQSALPRTDPSLLPVSNDRDAGLRDAANILLQADEAQRLGFNVTEDVVDNYLSRVCDNLFSETDYIQILKQTTGGQMTLPKLREHLKTELAALRLQDIMFSGMGSLGGQVSQFGVMAMPPEPFVTPMAAVASQQRINNTAKIEFMAIEVEPFLEKVNDEPSSRMIRDLYERGAVRFPDFEKKIPGFRKPDRAKIQWFQIDQDAFLPPIESITAEQIQAEYDRRVAAKDLSVIDNTPITPPMGPGDEPMEEGEGENTNPPDEGESTEGESTEAKPGDGDAGNGEPGSTSDDSDPPAESDGNQGQSEAGSGDPDGDGDGGQQSALAPPNQTQFVNTLLTQESGQEAEGTASTAQESSPPTTGAEETQETETPPATGETPPPAETQTPTTPPQEETGPKFKPLEAVRDTIIDALRRQAAGERRNKSLEEITERLDAYFVEHEIWDAERIEEPGLPAPPVPDFAAMAAKYGITFDETPEPVDFTGLSETELGQAFGEIPRNQFNFQNFPTVARVLFEGFRESKVYQPKTTLLRDYIYWISEKEPQHVPTLEECRDDIVRYWKWNAAVDLAKADAEAKLKQGSSLVEANPGKAFESQPFSWLSFGGGSLATGGGQLTLSSVNYMDGEELKELDTLGNEFMQTVFSLNENETAAAVDGLRETVFAVRLLEKESSVELAETAVKNQTQPTLDARRVVGTDIGQYQNDWVEDLLRRRNVRWTVKKAN